MGYKWIPFADRYKVPGETINAPIDFNITRGAGKDVVKFLRAIAHWVLTLRKPAILNFRNTDKFYVPGAILLFAELDRIISLSELTKPIKIIDPIKRRPREVMKQIGIHQLSGDNSEITPTRHDVVFWKAVKGSNQTGDSIGHILEYVAEKTNKEHARKIELTGIWRGISEAVANTVEHDYLSPRADGFQGLADTKWWMFTQLRDQRFTAAVCDLGCGYRSTVNNTIPQEFIARIASLLNRQNSDVQAIETAMEYGRSVTKL
ncbi:MAG: hypothetical protein WCE88_07050, partial [Burkholderiales bacterium]